MLPAKTGQMLHFTIHWRCLVVLYRFPLRDATRLRCRIGTVCLHLDKSWPGLFLLEGLLLLVGLFQRLHTLCQSCVFFSPAHSVHDSQFASPHNSAHEKAFTDWGSNIICRAVINYPLLSRLFRVSYGLAVEIVCKLGVERLCARWPARFGFGFNVRTFSPRWLEVRAMGCVLVERVQFSTISIG